MTALLVDRYRPLAEDYGKVPLLDAKTLAWREKLLTHEMERVLPGKTVGRHRMVAYEGDVEWTTDPHSGLRVVSNPVVWQSRVKRNLILTTGKTQYLARLAGLNSIAAFVDIGVGTDSTAPSAAQTQLNPSVAGSVLIQVCDSTYPSLSGTVLTFKATFGTATANFTWQEAGIFNGTTNGTSNIFNRVLIGPFAKSTAVSIAYTTTISQG